jgi:hypothetical protein
MSYGDVEAVAEVRIIVMTRMRPRILSLLNFIIVLSLVMHKNHVKIKLASQNGSFYTKNG